MANMVQKMRTTYTLVNGLNILKVFASLTYDVETLYILNMNQLMNLYCAC